MKELIRSLLKEQLQTKKSEKFSKVVSEIKPLIKQSFPNLEIDYFFNKNDTKGRFIIKILDNNLNFERIWKDVTTKVSSMVKNQLSLNKENVIDYIFDFLNYDFHTDEKNKFKNLPYIKSKDDIFKKINLDPKNFIQTFDGNKSEEIENKISTVQQVTSKDFYNEVKKFIQRKTDVPIDIQIRSAGEHKTLFVDLYPQISLDDFLSCKFTKWDFPHNIKDFERKIGEKFLFSSYFPSDHKIKGDFRVKSMLIEVKLIWPRSIGSYVFEKNKLLRDLLPEKYNERYGVRVEYNLCAQKPNIFVGFEHGTYLNQKDSKAIDYIVKKHFPNATINDLPGRYWWTLGDYKPDNKIYWSQEKLFKYFIDSAKNIFGDIYDYDRESFQDLETSTKVFCKQHEVWFDVIPSEHLKGKRCPFDNESKGEKLVRVYLEKKGVNYKTYHRIKDCFSELNGRCYTLPFDFFLPDLNLLIEYDGEQHYKAIDMWGGEEGLVRRQLLDGIKNRFAQDNNIRLIRIPYTVKKEEQLKQYLPDNLFE